MADNKTNTRHKAPTPIDNTYGHLQPQALDFERVVLGALMIDKDAFSIISEIIRPETFYEPRHQKIFTAIQTLNVNEHPVDIMTVTDELKREGTLDSVGGAAYIVELSSNVASSANIEYHARILAQKFLARQLISFASVIETKAFDDTVDVEELMQEAEGSLFELSQRNMKKDYVQVDPVIAKAVEILQKASANDGGLTGVPTGYVKLDEKTSGWQSSDLVIIAGRPAMGKTSFALSLAKNIAVDYHVPIAFFSLEMNNVQLVNRLISNVCEIPGNKMLNGQLTPDEWDRLDKRIGNLQGAPLYMNANGMKFGSRQEEVSKISQSLKGLAKELDIPILALSQLNRTVENREGLEGKRPQLSDLRESGAIEQDADMVLFVHRPEYYHIFEDEKGNDLRGMAQIIIAKHRKGAVGDVLLTFRGEFTRFQDPTPRKNNGAGEDVPPEGLIGSKLGGAPAANDDPFGASAMNGSMPDPYGDDLAPLPDGMPF